MGLGYSRMHLCIKIQNLWCYRPIWHNFACKVVVPASKKGAIFYASLLTFHYYVFSCVLPGSDIYSINERDDDDDITVNGDCMLRAKQVNSN